MEELEEGTGESSSPPRVFGGGHGVYEIRNEIYARLVESGNEEAVSNPDFREQLEAHFNRFPASYALDVQVDKAEDVLLHQKILAECEDPEKRPIFYARFIKYIMVDEEDNLQQSISIGSTSKESDDIGCDGDLPNSRMDFEPCSRLENLNLDLKKNAEDVNLTRSPVEALSARKENKTLLIHEIIFSSVDKPKLLSQLSALLSDLGLNIREAHVFSTLDGYILDVFVVDGWTVEETDNLLKELKEKAVRKNVSLFGSPHSSASEKVLELQDKICDVEIDSRLLKIGEKIASGSSGDLYRGTYQGEDVAVKVLRSEHLTNALAVEFVQEVDILRKINHKNVVSFYGACTKPPDICIVTEYMRGGNLYDFLHKHHNVLELSSLLKIAVDICKGMDYLHQNNIIHRDLKTANLLMDADQVVKIADFGVARLQSHKGDMTAETGTYRWMAPEVINHKPYDQKADVFSFAIVLWELATSKIPYDNLTPLQAALGVRQGMRPELPEGMHPKLSDLIQRCWEENPLNRPSFSETIIRLEELLQQVQAIAGPSQQGKAKVPKKKRRQ